MHASCFLLTCLSRASRHPCSGFSAGFCLLGRSTGPRHLSYVIDLLWPGGVSHPVDRGWSKNPCLRDGASTRLWEGDGCQGHSRMCMSLAGAAPPASSRHGRSHLSRSSIVSLRPPSAVVSLLFVLACISAANAPSSCLRRFFECSLLSCSSQVAGRSWTSGHDVLGCNVFGPGGSNGLRYVLE